MHEEELLRFEELIKSNEEKIRLKKIHESSEKANKIKLEKATEERQILEQKLNEQ